MKTDRLDVMEGVFSVKRLIAFFLVFMMLAGTGCAFAVVPEFPAVIENLDFGGATIWIFDWWHRDDEQHSGRTEYPDEDTLKRYEYVDWLEETYHCTIVETALSDWSGNPAELANMVLNRDDSRLCVVAIAADYVSTVLNNDLFMPWTVDLTGAQWNPADSALMTKKGTVYGVHPGKTEPRQCIFFNKRILAQAGIDPDSIYDAQAGGEWTWEMMEDLMDRVQSDRNSDGERDFYAMVGSGDDLAAGLMFSNDARYFDFDADGALVPAADRPEALAALAKRKEWMEKYMMPQPAGSEWDWYKMYWSMGTAAFYPGQTWQGFNDGSEMEEMEDEWGCVMFPKGPNAADYLAMSSDNIYGVPDVYDAETAEKIQQIFALYFLDTPGVETEDAWIGNKYAYTDDRAVEETYAMMREPGHSAPNLAFLLGTGNDVIGSVLLWGPLESMSPAEAVEAAKPVWQEMLDAYNSGK